MGRYQQTVRTGRERHVRLDFESWGDLLHRAAHGASTMDVRKRTSREMYEYRTKFTQTTSLQNALDMAQNGWPEGTDAAARRAYTIVEKLAAKMQRDDYYYDVTGLTFDVARVLENEPECWLNYEQVTVEAPGKVIRLVFNPSTSGAVSNSAMIARGATVAALVMLLERANFRVQVDLAWWALGDGVVQEVNCTLKSPSQDVDLPRLIFALAHPAMLRRILFSIRETFATADRVALRVPGTGGFPIDAPESHHGDVYIGCANSNDPYWESNANTARWLKSKLEEQGVKFVEEEQPPAKPYVPPPPPSPEEQKLLDAENAAWWAKWEAERPAREAAEKAAAALAEKNAFEDIHA